MNREIVEPLAREAGFYAEPDVEKFHRFAELIVEETISEMIQQLWNYGIPESGNHPALDKAIAATKKTLGVE